MNPARKLTNAAHGQATFNVRTGLLRRKQQVSPSEAIEALQSGRTVQVEETYERSLDLNGVRLTMKETQSTFLDSTAELDEFYGFRRESQSDTPRQELSHKVDQVNRRSSWSFSNVETGILGGRSSGDVGLSSFEAAGRLLEGEVVSANYVNTSKASQAFNRRDRDALEDSIENRFVAAPLDLESL